MKINHLILAVLFMLPGIGQIKAQTAPDLKLAYPWTKPELNPSENLNLFFGPPASLQKPQKEHFGIEGKAYTKWPMLIFRPDMDQLVEMPIARMDTSIQYHLRIKDLEVAEKGDKEKKHR